MGDAQVYVTLYKLKSIIRNTTIRGSMLPCGLQIKSN
jgi:hypothetical protein